MRLALFGGRKTVTLEPPRWPRVGPEETRAVASAMRAARTDPSWLTSASGAGVIEDFENAFAAKMGRRHAVATSGGGPALHTALMAAGVEAGDEVVCPTYSWGQTVSPVLQCSAIPVFADIDPESYTMTAATIEPRITRWTKAILVVHIFGHPAPMGPIMTLARKRGLPVIEDAAQAVGALYRGRRAGALGDIGCFSVGDGKQISGGEGGVLLTDRRDFFERALLFGQHPARHHRQIKNPALLARSDSLIYSYRMHPLAAAIALAMLPKLDRLNAERRRNHERLSRGLAGFSGIRPPSAARGVEHVYHRYSPSFVPEEAEGASREAYAAALAAEGVPIGLGYVRTPIHLRPTFRERSYFQGKGLPWKLHRGGKSIRYRKGDCPAAEERCARTELVLGGGPRWTGNQSRLVDQILAAFDKVSRNLKEIRRGSLRERLRGLGPFRTGRSRSP